MLGVWRSIEEAKLKKKIP